MAIHVIGEDGVSTYDIEPIIRQMIRDEIAIALRKFPQSKGKLAVDESKIQVTQPPPATETDVPPDPG